jgi:preprotein translocase subunit YajC
MTKLFFDIFAGSVVLALGIYLFLTCRKQARENKAREQRIARLLNQL